MAGKAFDASPTITVQVPTPTWALRSTSIHVAQDFNAAEAPDSREFGCAGAVSWLRSSPHTAQCPLDGSARA
jgi:hypothetical protein